MKMKNATCVCVCVCLCVFDCIAERESQKRGILTPSLMNLPFFPSLEKNARYRAALHKAKCLAELPANRKRPRYPAISTCWGRVPRR